MCKMDCEHDKAYCQNCNIAQECFEHHIAANGFEGDADVECLKWLLSDKESKETIKSFQDGVIND